MERQTGQTVKNHELGIYDMLNKCQYKHIYRSDTIDCVYLHIDIHTQQHMHTCFSFTVS